MACRFGNNEVNVGPILDRMDGLTHLTFGLTIRLASSRGDIMTPPAKIRRSDRFCNVRAIA